ARELADERRPVERMGRVACDAADRVVDHAAGIQRIVLTVYDEAIVYCGNRAPRTPIQAQFSLSFGIAAALRFGDVDPSVYAAPHFDDAELRRLEALVVLETDTALTARKQRGATLTVVHAGGVIDDTVGSIAGDAAHPLDRAALVGKFTRYAARSVAGPQAGRFCDAVLDAPAATALGLLWPSLGA
ncbi:MAG: MmgE/PrpD family protein, partial [Comamonadaceae bacterium]